MDQDAETRRTTRRKAPGNVGPHLIDNKRKHLEKNLSAAQRDKMLLQEAKEDAQFRKELAQAMHESSVSFSESIKDISKAMTDLGAGMCRSIEMLSRAFQQPHVPPPVNNNMFYQRAIQPLGMAPPRPPTGSAQDFHPSQYQQDQGQSSENIYYSF